ncbi:MAG TPA: Gfo/Idh/MocA family oxidoreductase [Allosphingosinicella sp.]|jgi:predicted dehydrogenase
MTRLGFIGTGWIGLDRMRAMLAIEGVEAVAICEPNPAMAAEALKLAPDAALVTSLDEMLALAPDGVVIATPSALHAAQCLRVLEAGAAVFCQKPLGRNAAEVEQVLAAARRADRLLGVDLSYRYTEGMRAVRELIGSGALGTVYAANLVFHNAYGPDKAWFYDLELSGGGCVIDLGIHLVDLALWTLDFPQVTGVSSRLYSKGRPLEAGGIEDFASATLDLEDGATVQVACSWNLAAGSDAVIGAEFYGTEGGAAFRNVDGSFYDFTAERLNGTRRERLADPPDAWGGRAAAHWAQSLAQGSRWSGSTIGLSEAATAIDRIYGASGRGGTAGTGPATAEASAPQQPCIAAADQAVPTLG